MINKIKNKKNDFEQKLIFIVIFTENQFEEYSLIIYFEWFLIINKYVKFLTRLKKRQF